MGEQQFVFILGGARSGKSALAEKMAAASGGPVAYIATAAAWDEEMRNRIAKHRQQRPANWHTVEEELWVNQIVKSLQEKYPVLLIDCLTLLVTNLLLNPEFAGREELSPAEQEAMILKELEQLAQTCRDYPGRVFMVSNEVGLSLVPENPLGRLYRDVAGRANQLMARYAHEVYLTVAGIPIELKEMGERLNKKIFGGELND